MNVLEEALIFAIRAHEGQNRKRGKIPYILHPAEVASIIATMTSDLEVMAAGVLHDTIEDCGVDPNEIRERFGARVAALVMGESEDRESASGPEEKTWMKRKEKSLVMLQTTSDINIKILWLGDKLSNIRSFARQYREEGDAMWSNYHQKDPKIQEWYYRTIAENTAELAKTGAYKEYCALVDEVFKKVEK